MGGAGWLVAGQLAAWQLELAAGKHDMADGWLLGGWYLGGQLQYLRLAQVVVDISVCTA